MQQLLYPGETIQETPDYRILVRAGERPSTPAELLQCLQNLWERLILLLRETDPDLLKELEGDMNTSLREAGALNRVKLQTENYLELLDPMIVTSGDWGIGPQIFQEELNLTRIELSEYLTAGSPGAKDPEVIRDLAQMLLDPLYLPSEYR